MHNAPTLDEGMGRSGEGHYPAFQLICIEMDGRKYTDYRRKNVRLLQETRKDLSLPILGEITFALPLILVGRREELRMSDKRHCVALYASTQRVSTTSETLRSSGEELAYLCAQAPLRKYCPLMTVSQRPIRGK